MHDPSFGEWLEDQRKVRRISQERLTELLGYADRSSVVFVERGKRLPSTEFARRVAAWLEIPAEQQEKFISLARVGKVQLSPRTPLPTSASRVEDQLIGRERELGEILALLSNPEVGLVTLVGTGGVGKTRLSIEMARKLSDDATLNVVFVDLGTLANDALVMATIADSLGIAVLPDQPVDETLRRHLLGRKTLLILDNFETVFGTAAQVESLAFALPHIKMLAASRSPLRIKRETEYAVHPLPLPNCGSLPQLEELARNPAVRLFLERATEADPHFELSTDNGPAIAEICTQVDGLPLGIELAAARIRYMSPRAMLSILPSGLALASRGQRNKPNRQQSLRASIDWSYNLLGEREQLLFRRLAVFPGGASFEAIQRVSPEGDHSNSRTLEATINALIELVDNSLLQQRDVGSVELRFSMLNTIREYAQEKLEESSEAETLREKHARYFLELVEEAEPHITGTGQGLWLNRIEREQGNIRAALRWTGQRAASGDRQAGELALRMAASLWRFWYTKGLYAEGREHLLLALANPPSWSGQVSPEEYPLLKSRAKALNGAAVLAWRQGDRPAAHSSLQEALALSRQLGDKASLATTMSNLGVAAHDQGDYRAAYACHTESLALRRELGDKWSVATSLHNLGRVPKDRGDYAQARTLYEESLTLYEELGDVVSLPVILGSLAVLAYELCDYPGACGFAERCLALYRELNDMGGIASALLILARITRTSEGYLAAQGLLEESLTLYQKIGAKPGIASGYTTMALAAQERQDYQEASALHRKSLLLRLELGDKKGMAACLAGIGGVVTMKGEAANGVILLSAARGLLESIGAVMDRDDGCCSEESIRQAKTRLSKAQFYAAWQDGQTMEIERAIQLALSSSELCQRSRDETRP